MPNILSSPFLNSKIIDSALSKATTPAERVQLLSAKVFLLSKDAPTSSSSAASSSASAIQNALPLMQARLELAKAQMTVIPPQLIEAEVELSTVEKTAKGFLDNQRRKSQNTGPTDGKEGEKETAKLVKDLEEIRKDALRRLVDLEEGLGRTGRAKKWQGALNVLENPPNS